MSCRAPSSFVCTALKVTVSGTLTDLSDSQSYTWKGPVCVFVCVRRGYNPRVDMSVSPRPAGVWPLLPRRPLTPVETARLQVAAGSLWKHLSPAWVIGHMGDSTIYVTPAVPGMFCEARVESMAAFLNSLLIPVILFWDYRRSDHTQVWI